MKNVIVWSIAGLALACGNPAPESGRKGPQPSEVVAHGERVEPPFEVKGEAEGLLLVWYDEQGQAHPASARAEIPEGQRARVRVDALDLAPEKRLDPAYVFIADLRAAGEGGRYSVRKVARAAFESALASSTRTEGQAQQASADVIIYGASWCGACKQAAEYFTQKGVPFREKDIEREPEARNEMLAKAKEQGVSTGGIPVIDVRGTLLGGFNPRRIEQLLASK